MLKLVKAHEKTEVIDSIKDQCVKILNNEWARSDTLRLRTLNSSKENMPMSLALVKVPENFVVGHGKLSEIPSNRSAIFIESVVIHPDLRGQGLGKILMLKLEQFCRDKGYKIAYLCTIDMQIFYSRCGYKFCKIIAASSGTVSAGMKNGMFKDNSQTDLVFDKKKQDEDLLPERTDDLGIACAKCFQPDPKLQEKEPVMKLPLSELKAAKPGTTEIGVHKDFMKKWLI